MKRLCFASVLLAVLVLSQVLLACSSPASPPQAPAAPQKIEPLVIKATHAYPATHIRQKAFLKMQELLDKYAPGRAKLEIYSDASLVPENAEIEAAKNGLVHLVLTNDPVLSTIDKTFSPLSLPFSFADPEQAWKFIIDAKGGQAMLKRLDPKGINGLGMSLSASVLAFYTSKKPLWTLADWKGQKLRAVNQPAYIESLQALGAQTVVLPIAEVYTALQTGMIEGGHTSVYGVISSRLHELAKYVLVAPLLMSGVTLIGNPAFWEKLPADLKGTMETRVIPETMRWFYEQVLSEEETAAADMKKAGVEVRRSSAEYNKELMKATEPVYAKLSAAMDASILARAKELR